LISILIILSLHGLSTEEKLLLSKARPTTLAAAKRIQGVTPVAVLELIRFTKKSRVQNGPAGARDIPSIGRQSLSLLDSPSQS